MNNFGQQSLTPGQEIAYITGVGWQYFTIINISPYILQINFAGAGSMDFPPDLKEDIAVPSSYRGQLMITPVAPYAGPVNATAPAAIMDLNGWIPGELAQPTSTPLGSFTAVAPVTNGIPQGAIPLAVTQPILAGGGQLLFGQSGHIAYLQSWDVTTPLPGAVGSSLITLSQFQGGGALSYNATANTTQGMDFSRSYNPPLIGVDAQTDIKIVVNSLPIAGTLNATGYLI